MKKIAIIGYGRFGALLADLYKNIFDVSIIETEPAKAKLASDSGFALINNSQLVGVDYIFLAVPISCIEELLIEISPMVSRRQVVIDMCSVKVFPVRLMRKYLKSSQILATHPMFGPDSAQKGLSGLQVAFCPISIEPENLEILKKAWQDLGVVVVVTTPEKHDEETAFSLAFTHINARIINAMNIPNIVLKTRSFNAMTEVALFASKDSDQLYHDMLFYNPYFTQLRSRLDIALQETCARLDQIQREQKTKQLFS